MLTRTVHTIALSESTPGEVTRIRYPVTRITCLENFMYQTNKPSALLKSFVPFTLSYRRQRGSLITQTNAHRSHPACARRPSTGGLRITTAKLAQTIATLVADRSRTRTVGGSPTCDGSHGGWCALWPAIKGQTAGGSWAGYANILDDRRGRVL